MGNKRLLEILNALLDEGLRKCDIIESLMDSIDKLDAEAEREDKKICQTIQPC